MRDRLGAPRRRSRGPAAFYWGVVLALSACGSGRVDLPSRDGDPVAVVNGEIILAQDVAAWANEHSVSRDDAIDALVDEALLVSEARRRGQRTDRSVVRRAAVQEILSEIEMAARPEDVASEAVRQEYDATAARVVSDPNVVMPPFEESESEIRTMLAGRERLRRLESLIPPPSLNEDRVARLLALPAID